MQKSLDAMTLALRVLTAINEKREPEPDDLEKLRAMAPLIGDSPPDELACDVIKLAIERRIHARTEAEE